MKKFHSITIKRKVNNEKLRNMCVKYNLFNKGDNKAYCQMFEEAEMITDETAGCLAMFILEHSITDRTLTNITYLICTETMNVYIDGE